MKSFGIGIIGCGSRVRNLAGRLLDQSPDIQLVGVADPSGQSIEAARGRFKCDFDVYENHEHLLTDERVQWVLIGSWNPLHREHAVAAMEAGKDVFCEKPLATALEDCLAIREAQQRTGRRFFLGFTLRYSPHYRRIKQIINEGAIGQIISLEFNETLEFNHGGFIHQDWRRFREHAGTFLLEKCCHDIDVAGWLVGSHARYVASFGGLNFFTPANQHHADRIGPNPAGRPAYQADGRTRQSPFETEKDIIDNQTAIIEYANSTRATFHTNCNTALPERRSYLCGTEGTLRADVFQGEIQVKRMGWDEPQYVYTTTAAEGGHGGGDAVLVAELAQCITAGAQPTVSVAHGLASALTCFGIDEAADSRQVVDLQSLWDRVQNGVEVAGNGRSL